MKIQSDDLDTSTDKTATHTQRGLGRATPVAIVATVVPILGSVATISTVPFAAPWLREQGWWGVVIFTACYVLACTFAIAPTYVTTVVAGWTFGFEKGFPAVMIGTVGGAAMCYLLARHLAGERVKQTFENHPRWEVVRRALLEESRLKTLWIIALMRLSPVLPYGTANVLLATTGVHFGIYVLGTLLGLLPRIAIVALAAAGAERLDLNSTESWWTLGAGIAATIVCIVIMAHIGKRALERATRAS